MLIRSLTVAICLAGFATPEIFAKDIATTSTASNQAVSADRPDTVVPKPRQNKGNRFMIRHQQNLLRTEQGPVDLLFLGDSITDRWSSSTAVWNRYFGKWNPANFGVGGDRTQNVLWRIQNGELDGISPKVIVLMIGTNNTHSNSPEDIVTGIKAILQTIDEKQPEAMVLLLGIFPREPKMRDGKLNTMPMDKIKVINKRLPALAKEGKVRFLDISDAFLVDGKVPKDVMPDGVHVNEKGYEIWGRTIKPVLEEMMQ